jgi:4-aminobutyrate aminotransferase
MVIEPVIGEGGYIVPPQSFLQGLRRICDEHGILLVLDEVQTGFGRTGTLFAFEQFGIVPDVLIMAKGLASGLPLSAIAARRAIMGRWRPGSHGGTYGGNALACAAAVATLQVMHAEHLPQRAAALGQLLRAELMALREDETAISDVRGLGLMVGVELAEADGSPAAALARRVLARCRDAGLLLLSCGPYDNVVRFIPPLVVDEAQLRHAVRIFGAALRAG